MRTINDGWEFTKEGKTSVVNIPHTWSTDAYEGRNYYQGKGTYTRRLFAPESWKGGNVYLKVDAASKWADVYVNDVHAGSHPGGYTAFIVDLSDKLAYGKDNEIRIEVDNSRKDVTPISADFTFMGGIYRDVWIMTVPEAHFSMDTETGSDNLFISTPYVSDEKATVALRGAVTTGGMKKLNVVANVYGPEGNLLISKTLKKVGGDFSAELGEISSPHLWTPETPVLYKVETLLEDKDGNVLDHMEHHTAFRWFSIDPQKGFFLNGKPYKLRGFNRHQDQWPFGVAIHDESHRRDFRLMKEMGANFIRIAHYPQDDALLEMCDREGMLVWEEIPIVNTVPDTPGYQENCERNLREMIRQHYNHPSVFTWGYMNEILLTTMQMYRGEQLTSVIDRTRDFAKKLEAVLDEEDPSRLSTMALHYEDIYNQVDMTDITDMIGWNIYSGWYSDSVKDFEAYLENQHRNHPTHSVIVSEWGAGSDKRLHSLEPKKFDFSSEYQQYYIEHYLPVIEDSAYVLGGAYWNFIDFNVAARQESMPRTNNKGICYNDRTPKDVFYYFKAAWREDVPVLHIASRDWSQRFGIRTGTGPVMLPVKVYTNQPEVELSIDGKSLGTKKVENFNVVFDVPFSSSAPLLEARAGNVRDAVRVRFGSVPDKISADDAEGLELAVNVGSNCFFTSSESNLTWVPDREYAEGGLGHIGGKDNVSQNEIFGTLDTPLYQTQRQGLEGYRFDVPEGDYEVELLFADILPRSHDVFDIVINGDIVELSFCPSSDGQAKDNPFFAVRRRYIVRNNASSLEVRFNIREGNSFLSGIKLRKL